MKGVVGVKFGPNVVEVMSGRFAVCLTPSTCLELST